MAKKKPVPKGVRNAAAISAANPNLTLMQEICASGGYREQDCQNSHLSDGNSLVL